MRRLAKKYSHLFVTAVLAGSLSLPAAVQAQVNSGGTTNYGIFGGGTNTGAGFSRGSSSGFGQSQSGGFGQQGLGGGASAAFGRSAALGVGSSSTVSPYLNMLRGGNPALNYIALVRPQVRQDQLNGQAALSFQQTNQALSEQQQRIRQDLDPNLANADVPQSYRKVDPNAQTNRRRANANDDADFHDWASSYKDQDGLNGAKSSQDSRQRATSLRQAKELRPWKMNWLEILPAALLIRQRIQ
jgi:hypothetical protein